MLGLAGDELEVDGGAACNVAVVALAELPHGLPVVGLVADEEREGGDEDEGAEEGDDVAGEHGVVGAGAGDVQAAGLFLGGDEPGDEGADEAERRGQGGGEPALAAPEEGQTGGEDGGGDDDAHEEVEVAHGDADVVEAGAETGHDECPRYDRRVGDADEFAARGGGGEIAFVNIVRGDGGDGD